MSLSRPATLPLLKLPYLCIECIIRKAQISEIILFALISQKTRRIVKRMKIPLNKIQITSTRSKWITLGNCNIWCFNHGNSKAGAPLVLQKNAIPLYTSECSGSLHSHTAGSKLAALLMGINFLNDVFECSTEHVRIDVLEIPKSGKIGVNSTVDLYIAGQEQIDKQILKLFLENLKVTGRCQLENYFPADFSYDPKLFKCNTLWFSFKNSANWVTLDVLCKFDVPELHFDYHKFSVDDIVSFITHWFNSENRTLKLLYLRLEENVTLEDFQIGDLNPVPFSEERRSRWSGSKFRSRRDDLSDGRDILRSDGLLATLWIDRYHTGFSFYVWHERFPDASMVL